MNKLNNSIIHILRSRSFDIETFRSMQELCAPLVKKLGFSAFEYAKVYDDQTAFILYSDPTIANYIISKEYHISAHAPQEVIRNEFWYIPGMIDTYAQSNENIKSISNSNSCINYIRRHAGFYEMFCFWTSEDRNLATIKFFNFKEALEQYACNFTEQAKGLILLTDQDRFKLTDAMLPNFQGLDVTQPSNHIKFNFYIKRMQQELVKLNTVLPHKLSSQELKCIHYLIEGKTATDIAKLLHLSPRTIEMHLNSIKLKLNCPKKSAIVGALIALAEYSDKINI